MWEIGARAGNDRLRDAGPVTINCYSMPVREEDMSYWLHQVSRGGVMSLREFPVVRRNPWKSGEGLVGAICAHMPRCNGFPQRSEVAKASTMLS